MSTFSPVPINKKQIRADLKDFRALLDDPGRPDLSESKDILPFFKGHPQLCAFMGTYNPSIVDFKNIVTASEFDIFGDHVADLAVGDTTRHQYCFIEFEDARASSIFRKVSKATPEWAPRFEHGFSQLLDWILWIENEESCIRRAGVEPGWIPGGLGPPDTISLNYAASRWAFTLWSFNRRAHLLAWRWAGLFRVRHAVFPATSPPTSCPLAPVTRRFRSISPGLSASARGIPGPPRATVVVGINS
jgi:Domain of unknown function (DUF4263)